MPPETIVLPGETSSVPSARRFVQTTLAQWELDELAWTGALLVSELAANACLHAGTGLAVTLSRTSDGVRLEVRDGSPVVPRMRRHDELATTGRGMRLVGDLAQRWGVEEVAGGKVVWAELVSGTSGRREDAEHDEAADVEQLLAAFGDDADVTRACARATTRQAA